MCTRKNHLKNGHSTLMPNLNISSVAIYCDVTSQSCDIIEVFFRAAMFYSSNIPHNCIIEIKNKLHKPSEI